MKPIVNTLIIGAAKAGTTTLAAWLDGHSNCCVSRPKETGYFASERACNKGSNWYHSTFFSHFCGEAITCDATPSYSNRDYHADIPLRVFKYDPNVRLVYLVRHPRKRIESAWRMFATFPINQKTRC